jgi:hypothetical protein
MIYFNFGFFAFNKQWKGLMSNLLTKLIFKYKHVLFVKKEISVLLLQYNPFDPRRTKDNSRLKIQTLFCTVFF